MRSCQRYKLHLQIQLKKYKMVQELHVLRCYSCDIFQVQIVKKIKKWVCKLCNEKQSVQKVYFQGSGQDCRLQVQHLNFMKHINDTRESEVLKKVEVIREDSEEDQKPLITNSKWTKYLVEPQKEFHDEVGTEDDGVDQSSNLNNIDIARINEESKENKTKDFISKEQNWESSGLAYQTAEQSACNSSFPHSLINDDEDNEDNRCSLPMQNHGKRKFFNENTETFHESDSQLFSTKRTKFTDESSDRKKNLCDIIKSNRSNRKGGKCSDNGTGVRVVLGNGGSVTNEINESLVTNELIISKPNRKKITVFQSDYDDLDDNFHF